MKPALTILTFLAALLCMGCSREATETADVIIVSQDRVAFAESGGKVTVSVACPSEWKADCTADWIGLAVDGSNLVISAQANATGQGRTASIALQSGADLTEIQVSQAWSGNLVQLSINAPEALDVISGGDKFTFSVSSNTSWSAAPEDAGDTWISCTSDPESGIVNVSIAPNEGEARTGALLISTQDGSASATVSFSQISKAEDPYYRMLGSFGLMSERWYYKDGYLDFSGIGTYCTIEEVEYPESFLIKDLFAEGTEIQASYDKDSGTMSIDLGRLCMTRDMGNGSFLMYYPVAIDIESKSFSSMKISGTLGEKEDEEGNLVEAVVFGGFTPPYTSFGLIGSSGASYAFFSDLYYAVGEMYLIRSGADNTMTD